MATNYFGDDKEQTIINSSLTGKSQALSLDDTKVLDPAQSNRLVSGDINDAIKSTITGGRDVIGGGTNGTLASHTLVNDTIVGDATNLTATTFTGGADKITLAGMDDNGTTIIGDAVSANGGTTRGGNDTIIVTGAITGGTIIGDVKSVTNTTFTAGNDNIQLKSDVTGAYIYTDAMSLSGVNTLSGGNDIVTLGIKGKEGETSVASSLINLGHGTNTLIAYSTLAQGTSIRGGSGTDKITTNTVNIGASNVLIGGSGNDNFNIVQLLSGSIYGNDGNDTITVKSINISTSDNTIINAGLGNDVLNITEAKGIIVRGDEGNDKINIGEFQAKEALDIVYGDEGNDTIDITTVSGSIIFGDDDVYAVGNDSIVIDNLIINTENDDISTVYGGGGSDIIKVNYINGSSIKGGYFMAPSAEHPEDGADKITVGSSTGGSIEGQEGDDSINVTNSIQSTVNGGEGDDSIFVKTAEQSSNILGHMGKDTITITNLKQTTVNGSMDDDVLNLTNVDNSIVLGGEGGFSGNDKINATNVINDSSIAGGMGNDTITITKSIDSIIRGDDSEGGSGNDSIKITTATASTIYGDDANDNITVNTLQASTIKIAGITSIVRSSELYGGDGDDSITIITLNNSSVFGDTGNDSLKITTIAGESSINLGAGNDSLFVSSNKSINLNDTSLANSLGEGSDTLQVNWAFNGTFTSSSSAGVDDGDTLITRGLGKYADLVFGAGNDNLTITGVASGNKSGLSDTQLSESLGEGQDTLNVGWIFNGIFDVAEDGGTLITKGLNTNSKLQFGDNNDGLQVVGALANRELNTFAGADTISISGTATNVQVDLGKGADIFSVGSMGKNSTLTYNTDGLDNITIKGTYTNGMVVDAAGKATDLSTGADGGSITLDTLGSGQLAFGGGADNLIINKNLAGTSAVKKEISTLGGDDNINLKGTVTHTIVDADTGSDMVSIGALSTGSILRYNADGVDSITVKGTYNAGLTQTTVGANFFYGLATDNLDGTTGGSITLDTLGTGKLQFGNGSDTLIINKALSGSLGLKDIFMQGGNDSVILNSVNGAVVNAGAAADYISATALGATGVLNGDAGADTLQFGRIYTDASSFKATATMSNGTIHSGDDNDTIYIGNTLDEDSDGNIENIKGTLSGGKVYGGLGDDRISTTTLSGTGLMDGGAGVDRFYITNMNGGSISGGDSSDFIVIENTLSRGTINGDAGDDSFKVASMSGGTINGDLGDDTFSIDSLKGGVINSNDDADVDSITIETMVGGTINSGADDKIKVTTMSGGIINDSAENSGTISIDIMTKGTINGNGGNDSINITTMNGGSVNGQDGNDSLTVTALNGGILNAGEGDNKITIADALNGGTISAGKGNDTLVLSDNIVLSGKYNINLGAGDNAIWVQSGEGQALTLGTSHDYVHLGVNINKINNTKINSGTGNDTIVSQSMSITNTIIDASSGNDSINLVNVNVGTFIYGGVGNDTIKIDIATDAVIDAGTGSDSINVNNVQDSSIITYDAAGQDTISLGSYREGMVVGAGGKNEISTGNDGGTIVISNWLSGNIIFGNGNDEFIINSVNFTTKIIDLKSGNDTINFEALAGDGRLYYNSAGFDSISINDIYDGTKVYQSIAKDGTEVGSLTTGTDGGFIHVGGLTAAGAEAISFSTKNDHFSIDKLDVAGKTIDLKTGTDSITVGTLTAGTIEYDSAGFDSISINGVYNGTGISSVQGRDTVDKGLTTGTDGGFIHVDSLGNNVNTSNLSFSDKNDHFSIGTLNNAGLEIDLRLGTDSITVDTLSAGTIKYNNVGFDSIVINGAYNGTGISDGFGNLSTGVDGGYIHIDTLSAAGAAKLSFDRGADRLSMQSVSGGAMDLKAGNDSVTLGIEGNDTLTSMGNTDLTLGDGNDTLTSHSKIAAFSDISAGNGNDVFNINVLDDANGHVSGDSGNDSFEINSILQSNVFGGLGKDSFNIASMTSEYSRVSGGEDNDIFDIEQMSNGLVRGATGNDSFDIASMSGGEVCGDEYFVSLANNVSTGADKFIIDSLGRQSSICGDSNTISSNVAGPRTFKAGNDVIAVNGDLSGLFFQNGVSIYGDAQIVNAKTFIAGNDNLILKGNVSNADIYTDAENIHNETISSGGNDTITLGIKAQSGATYAIYSNIFLGHGNDVLTAYSILGERLSIDAGIGDDRMSAYEITSDAVIYGGEGNDKFTITTMHDGYVSGDAGNDSINISTVTGGRIVGGEAIQGTNSRGAPIFGVDTITFKNISDTTIYGDYLNDYLPEKVDYTTSYSDIIRVTGISTNSIINASYGNDTISIATARGGSVLGGSGNDQITVTTGIGDEVNGGFGLDAGVGFDAVNMTTLNRGVISGGEDTDVITVKNAYNSIIYGDKSGGTNASGDVIKVTGLAENTKIYGDSGSNIISVGTATANTNIYGDAGNDTINVTTANLGTNIYGGVGQDNITVSNITDSTIDGGEGLDVLTVRNQLKGVVFFANDNNDSTVEADKIMLSAGVGSGANITLFGSDGFDVARTASGAAFSMSGGTINASTGDDIFNVSMSAGTINGAEGDDRFNLTISGASKGSVIGGAGADTFSLSSSRTSSITLNDFDAREDTLLIKGTNYTADALAAQQGGQTSFSKNGITVNFGSLFVDNSGVFSISNLSSRTIHGAAVANDISIETMSNSQIYTQAYADNIEITTMFSGLIDSGGGEDSVSVDDLQGGSIYLGSGDDNLYVNAIQGILDGGEGDDYLYLRSTINEDTLLSNIQASVTSFEEFGFYGMSSGSLMGTSANDVMYIYSMTGGSLNGNAGADILNVRYINGGIIDGGADAFSDIILVSTQLSNTVTFNNSGSVQDTLYLNDDLESYGVVRLTGSAGFKVSGYDQGPTTFDIVGGSISATDYADVFTVGTMSKGSVNLNGGNDSISIASASGGSIRGGLGDDTFTLTLTGNDIMLDGGSGSDLFNINASNAQNVTMIGFGNGDRLFVNGNNITSAIAGEIGGGIYTHEGVTVRFLAEVDNITFDQAINRAEILYNNDGEKASVYINAGIVAGGAVHLEGENNSPFTVTNSSQAGFDMYSGASLIGSAMNDTISINSAYNASMNAKMGNDSVNIDTMNYGVYLGGEGNDTITVNSLKGGVVYGGIGHDRITVSNYTTNGFIYGGAGNDTIFVTLNDPDSIDYHVRGDSGADEFRIFSGTPGTINLWDFYGFDGDTLFVDGHELTAGAISAQYNGKSSLQIGDLTINFMSKSIDDVVNVNYTINSSKYYENINYTSSSVSNVNSGYFADIINLNGGMNNGSLDLYGYGDFVLTSNSGSFDMHNSKLTIETGWIYGVARTSDDFISINSMTANSVLDTQNGYDTIYINSLNDNSEVLTGAQEDRIYVGIMNGGTIDSGSSADFIHIDVLNAGVINSTSSGDTIRISEANGGRIVHENGNIDVEIESTLTNTITLINHDGRFNIELYGGIGEGGRLNLEFDPIAAIYDDFNIARYEDDSIGFNMNGGELIGSSGDEFIKINVMNNSYIDLGTGENNIEITTMNNGTLITSNNSQLSSDHQDDITITTMNNSVIKTNDFTHEFNIGEMNNSSIETGDGTSYFNIGDMVNSTINVGDGWSDFNISNMHGGNIISSSGNKDTDTNRFEITGDMTGGTIIGNDHENRFEVGSRSSAGHVLSSMSGGSIEGGDGRDTFYITIDSQNAGSLTGGTGVDYFGIRGTDGSSITITDFTYTDVEKDGLNINGSNRTRDAADAIADGQNFYIYDGVTIYFS